MIEISETNKAYFAGLLDGEGCIYINKVQRKKEDRGDGYSLRVDFNLTYAPVLYDMKKIFGGNVTKVDMEKTKRSPSMKKNSDSGCVNLENIKQSYLFHLSGKEAWYFLKVVEQFCREKKEQVLVAIEFFQGRRPFAGVRGRSQSETNRCEFYYKKLQELKKLSSVSECFNEDNFIDSQQKISFFEEE